MSKVRKGIVVLVLVTAAVCAVVPVAMGETSASAATAAKAAVPKVVPDAGSGDVFPCGRGSTWQ